MKKEVQVSRRCFRKETTSLEPFSDDGKCSTGRGMCCVMPIMETLTSLLCALHSHMFHLSSSACPPLIPFSFVCLHAPPQIMHHLAGHPNVVNLKGVYEDKTNVTLAMEVSVV